MAKRRRRGFRDFGQIEMLGADDMMGDWGEGGREGIAGPLIGGGVAQVGTLATKLIWRGRPIANWGGAIGAALGGLVSGILMARPATRGIGLSGLITAALVGIPRQIEDLMMTAGLKDYLGVITPEREMQGYFGEDETQGYFGQDDGMGQQDVQLLDSGAGSTLGVTTAEQEMAGGGGFGQDPVQIMGATGFGTNFMSNM